MSIYFLVLDADFFHAQAVPTLARSWRERSFAPCIALCESLKPAAMAYAARFHTGSEPPILSLLAEGLAFDRDIWRLLAGEVLLFGALDVPEVLTAPDTLACLLAPEKYLENNLPRSDFSPIHQVHFGTRDLVFGNVFYRPDDAGLNDVNDVARLAAYLESVDSRRWSMADLVQLRGMGNDEERQEELEMARDWFPLLQTLYREARAEEHVIVCEVLGE